ncbi:hypothetical protein RI054_24g101780 [Pseudoscourfieldia marina]
MRPYATRSFAEVRFGAYLLHALGLLPKLREALLRGDTCLKSDAAIALEDMLCIFEFDPGTLKRHRGVEGEDMRALQDGAKSQRMRRVHKAWCG